MPLTSRFLSNDDFMTLGSRDEGVKSVGTDMLWVFINGCISLVLVLLGGFFAGLTLAYVHPFSHTFRVMGTYKW
jgi:hypothetical protein